RRKLPGSKVWQLMRRSPQVLSREALPAPLSAMQRNATANPPLCPSPSPSRHSREIEWVRNAPHCAVLPGGQDDPRQWNPASLKPCQEKLDPRVRGGDEFDFRQPLL